MGKGGFIGNTLCDKQFLTIIYFILNHASQRKEEGKDNQVPHLTRGTIWESDTNSRKHHSRESQEISPFPAGDHKAIRNGQDSIIKATVKHK